MKGTQESNFKKKFIALLFLSVISIPLVGCSDDGEESKKKKADAELQEWLKKGADFKHSEPKKSAF